VSADRDNDGGRVPAAWLRSYTLGDMAIIDALSDEQRIAVERYARHAGHQPERTDAAEEAYREGWEDAIEEAQHQIGGVGYTPRRRKHMRIA
jgi:hypothetical protein